jgi:tRNA threonylcarbamoyladenosine modification (KEOPS) complex  Pcc1 subunit
LSTVDEQVFMQQKGEARVRCSIVIAFDSAPEAENVHRSVSLDNDGYIETVVKGNDIVATVEADSLKSLLHTLDDFLSCVSVAERIVSGKD